LATTHRTCATTTEGLKRLSAAKAWMLIHNPFFGFLLVYMKYHVVEDGDMNIPTAATDGSNVWWNLKFLNSISDDGLRFVLAHEVMHVALRHTSRRTMGNRFAGKGMANGKINRAADFVINALLKDSGFKLLKGALYDPAYAGMSTEKVYKLLPDDPADDKCNQSGEEGIPGSGGWCDDHSQWGKGEDGAMAEQEWKKRIASAASYSKDKMPRGMKELVENIVHPNIPWRKLVATQCQATMSADYQWTPQNRRHIWDGIYLPGRAPAEMFEGSVYFDVSGSVGSSDIEEFIGGMDEVMSTFEEWEIELSMFDTDIRKTITLKTGDSLEEARKIVGRGGTDFSVCFTHAVREGRKPKVVVIFTDGHCPFPPNDQGLNVIWIYTRDAAKQDPPYGLICRIGD
jgi:predicted metal-dependent peptidase